MKKKIGTTVAVVMLTLTMCMPATVASAHGHHHRSSARRYCNTTCTVCDGTGRYRKKDCTNCGGDGVCTTSRTYCRNHHNHY